VLLLVDLLDALSHLIVVERLYLSLRRVLQLVTDAFQLGLYAGNLSVDDAVVNGIEVYVINYLLKSNV
jgi:hypothetical protein